MNSKHPNSSFNNPVNSNKLYELGSVSGFDIAHLAHVEILTNKYDESLDFFTRIFGLTKTYETSKSAYLRAYDDYEFATLKLTRSNNTGVAHIAYRTSSRAALERRVRIIEEAGYGLGWSEGDESHGRAYRFGLPGEHVFEIYWDTNWYQPPDAEKSALKNLAQKFHGRGCCPRRIDHLNLLTPNVERFKEFLVTCLSSRITEEIILNDGKLAGSWFTVNNKTYDLACTEDFTGASGRFHHVTYATDQREDILRAADIFLENNVYIETGPHKHAIQGTFFLYVYEPAGNRVELANSGARLLLAPDWKPIRWTQSDRMKGQAWGLKTIESFHTYGTPQVEKKVEH